MTKTATAEPTKQNARPIALAPGRLTEPGQKNVGWNARIPDAEWDHLMTPTYFGVRYVMQLNAGDTIRCYNESATRWAELYVAATTPNGASVDLRMLQQGEMAAATHEVYEDASHRIEWKGLSEQYTIVQKNNGATLAKNIKSMSDARYRLVTDHTIRRVA